MAEGMRVPVRPAPCPYLVGEAPDVLDVREGILPDRAEAFPDTIARFAADPRCSLVDEPGSHFHRDH